VVLCWILGYDNVRLAERLERPTMMRDADSIFLEGVIQLVNEKRNEDLILSEKEKKKQEKQISLHLRNNTRRAQ
jgi:hypothetical protein